MQDHTTYEYQIVSARGSQTKFLSDVNGLGRKGWRIIHYATEGATLTAVLELSKPRKEAQSESGTQGPM